MSRSARTPPDPDEHAATTYRADDLRAVPTSVGAPADLPPILAGRAGPPGGAAARGERSAPVPSRISRTRACALVSPGSILPPGRDHFPASGSCPRMMSSSRPAPCRTVVPTQGMRVPFMARSPLFSHRAAFRIARLQHISGTCSQRNCRHRCPFRRGKSSRVRWARITQL